MPGTAETIEIAVPSWPVPPARLVTPRSWLNDRIRMECEIIALPPKTTAAGQITLRTGPFEAVRPDSGGRRLLPRRREPTETVPEGRWIVDLRRHEPRNWAHFLNNHLPLVFRMTEIPGFERDKALLLLPKDCPGYILAAATLFELEAWATDAPVSGPGIDYAVEPWIALRSMRAGWVGNEQAQAALARSLGAPDPALPAKPFLVRRDTRVLSNQDAVEKALAPRGFVPVYAEDLSAADQIRLFRQAEEVVAIHGAALAPLLYTGAGQGGPRRLIELMPVGHMTDVYRVMAAQTGCDWIGVRGRIEARHIDSLYTPGPAFTKHSLDPFEIDPASLDLAFALLDGDPS